MSDSSGPRPTAGDGAATSTFDGSRPPTHRPQRSGEGARSSREGPHPYQGSATEPVPQNCTCDLPIDAPLETLRTTRLRCCLSAVQSGLRHRMGRPVALVIATRRLACQRRRRIKSLWRMKKRSRLVSAACVVSLESLFSLALPPRRAGAGRHCRRAAKSFPSVALLSP